MPQVESKNICLFGPQGSGKGTQAEKLSLFFGVPHVSPGNIFRKAITDKTELGQRVEQVMNAGQLVPNDITNTLMRNRLQEEDCLEGFILDGYPRNKEQADALDAMTALSHVLLIHISDEESVHRISLRRVCSSCGMTYHPEWKPPVVEGVCDACGQALMQRDDDKPEAIRERLRIYHTETEPLLQRYSDRGILHRIDGVGSIEDVWQRVHSLFV